MAILSILHKRRVPDPNCWKYNEPTMSTIQQLQSKWKIRNPNMLPHTCIQLRSFTSHTLQRPNRKSAEILYLHSSFLRKVIPFLWICVLTTCLHLSPFVSCITSFPLCLPCSLLVKKDAVHGDSLGCLVYGKLWELWAWIIEKEHVNPSALNLWICHGRARCREEI